VTVVTDCKLYLGTRPMPGERKSVEPRAGIVAPTRVSAKHQSLLHLVAKLPGQRRAVLGNVRDRVLPSIERKWPAEVRIVDDTGITKKGSIRSASRGSIAVGSASRTIVGSQ
jgi:SRSO17 transposase